MTNDLKPTHGVLRQEILDASLALIDNSPHGEVSGADVARHIGISLNDQASSARLYHAFKAVHDSGYLRCYFPGGMQLPLGIRRP